LRHFVPAIIWFIVIFVLCAMPGKDIPHVSWLEVLAFDKWVHAGIFFVLSVLIMRAVKLTRFNIEHFKTVIVALAFCIPYGGLLEIMQGTMFADRSADLYDFIANSVGAIIGVTLYRKLADRFQFFKSR
jgi:VanZ family protein